MGGVGGYYAKWNKSDKDTVWYHLYVESKKIQPNSEYSKKKWTHRHGEQTSGYQWGEGRGGARQG